MYKSYTTFHRISAPAKGKYGSSSTGDFPWSLNCLSRNLHSYIGPLDWHELKKIADALMPSMLPFQSYLSSVKKVCIDQYLTLDRSYVSLVFVSSDLVVILSQNTHCVSWDWQLKNF